MNSDGIEYSFAKLDKMERALERWDARRDELSWDTWSEEHDNLVLEIGHMRRMLARNPVGWLRLRWRS